MSRSNSPNRSSFLNTLKMSKPGTISSSTQRTTSPIQRTNSPVQKMSSPPMTNRHSGIKPHVPGDTSSSMGYSACVDGISGGRSFYTRRISKLHDGTSNYHPLSESIAPKSGNNINRFEVSLDKGTVRGRNTPKTTNGVVPINCRVGQGVEPMTSADFAGPPRVGFNVEDKTPSNSYSGKNYKRVNTLHGQTPVSDSTRDTRRVSFSDGQSHKPRISSTDRVGTGVLGGFQSTHVHSAVPDYRSFGNEGRFYTRNKQHSHLTDESGKCSAYGRETLFMGDTGDKKVYRKTPPLQRPTFDLKDFEHPPSILGQKFDQLSGFGKPHLHKAGVNDTKHVFTSRRHSTSPDKRGNFKSMFPFQNKFKYKRSHSYNDNSDANVSHSRTHPYTADFDKTRRHSLPNQQGPKSSFYDNDIDMAQYQQTSYSDGSAIHKTSSAQTKFSDERNSDNTGRREMFAAKVHSAVRSDKKSRHNKIGHCKSKPGHKSCQSRSYLKITTTNEKGKYSRLYPKEECSDNSIEYEAPHPQTDTYETRNDYNNPIPQIDESDKKIGYNTGIGQTDPLEKRIDYDTSSRLDNTSKHYRAFCSDEKPNFRMPHQNSTGLDIGEINSTNVAHFSNKTDSSSMTLHPQKVSSNKKSSYATNDKFNPTSDRIISYKKPYGHIRKSGCTGDYKIPSAMPSSFVDKKGGFNKSYPYRESLDSICKNNTLQSYANWVNGRGPPKTAHLYTASVPSRPAYESPYQRRATSENRHEKTQDHPNLQKISSDTSANYNPQLASLDKEVCLNGSNRKTVNYKNGDRLEVPSRQGGSSNTIHLHTTSSDRKERSNVEKIRNHMETVEFDSLRKQVTSLKDEDTRNKLSRTNGVFQNKTASHLETTSGGSVRKFTDFSKTQLLSKPGHQPRDFLQLQSPLADDGFLTLYQSHTREDCSQCKQRVKSEPYKAKEHPEDNKKKEPEVPPGSNEPANNSSASCDNTCAQSKDPSLAGAEQVEGNTCNHSDRYPDMENEPTTRLSLLRQSIVSVSGTDAEDGSPNKARRKRRANHSEDVECYKNKNTSHGTTPHTMSPPKSNVRLCWGQRHSKTYNPQLPSQAYSNNKGDEAGAVPRRKGSTRFERDVCHAGQRKHRTSPLVTLNSKGRKVLLCHPASKHEDPYDLGSYSSGSDDSSSEHRGYSHVSLTSPNARPRLPMPSFNPGEQYTGIHNAPYMTNSLLPQHTVHQTKNGEKNANSLQSQQKIPQRKTETKFLKGLNSLISQQRVPQRKHETKFLKGVNSLLHQQIVPQRRTETKGTQTTPFPLSFPSKSPTKRQRENARPARPHRQEYEKVPIYRSGYTNSSQDRIAEACVIRHSSPRPNYRRSQF